MSQARSISDILRGVIRQRIAHTTDPVGRKELIMIAHGDGHLSDSEVADLIKIHELTEA